MSRQGDRVLMLQGDRHDGGTRRDLLAQVLVAAPQTPAAIGKTVEVFTTSGPPSDLLARYAAAAPDPPRVLDAAGDAPNMPLADEPERVVAELQRIRAGDGP